MGRRRSPTDYRQSPYRFKCIDVHLDLWGRGRYIDGDNVEATWAVRKSERASKPFCMEPHIFFHLSLTGKHPCRPLRTKTPYSIASRWYAGLVPLPGVPR